MGRGALAAAALLAALLAPGARATSAAEGQHDAARHHLGLVLGQHRARRRHDEEVALLERAPGGNVGFLQNLTLPTVPPATSLDPWSDIQPVDTAIGELLASGMVARPTATPPPDQSSLDLVRAGCPLLTTWPTELEVHAVDPCGPSGEGSWRLPGKAEPLVSYRQSCSPFAGGLAPLVSYSTASGELLAQSQLMTTLVGSKIALMDCAGIERYYLEERVYQQAGSVDSGRCERYGSCTGTVWMQYFLFSPGGSLIAHTGYMKLFESQFDVVDAATGIPIASVSRLGDWEPPSPHCTGPRRWTVRFNQHQPRGRLASPTEQWPVAALVTVISLRDVSRRPSGLLMPSWCEVSKTTLSVGLVFIVIAVCLTVVLTFMRDALEPCKIFLYHLENRICPKRMKIPSRYENA